MFIKKSHQLLWSIENEITKFDNMILTGPPDLFHAESFFREQRYIGHKYKRIIPVPHPNCWSSFIKLYLFNYSKYCWYFNV